MAMGLLRHIIAMTLFIVEVEAREAEAEATTFTRESLAVRELTRRRELVSEGEELLKKADSRMIPADYVEAMRLYRQAWDILPDAPLSSTQMLRARDGYSRAAVAHASNLADGARFAEARQLLRSVLASDFNPDCTEAIVLQDRLDDLVRYEPASTSEHQAKMKEVEVKLRLGQGFLSLGDYDAAILHFKEVLQLDPYNGAARRGMERAERHKSDYYVTARDHARAKSLGQVDVLWDDPVPMVDVSHLFGSASAPSRFDGELKEDVLRKLRTLIVPMVDFDAVGLAEVVEFLRIRSRELDPARKGVGFVLNLSPEDQAKTVTLQLASVPLEEVLRHAMELVGAVYRVDEHAVVITSKAGQREALVSRQFRVPPDFLQTSPAAQANGALQLQRLSTKDLLMQRGVPFPQDAFASYSPATNVLFVRNTVENMQLVDALVDQALNATGKQVEVQVRMIEVSENRLKELGFDWLLGQFNMPATERIFGSGGEALGATGAIPIEGNHITGGLRNAGSILDIPLFGVPTVSKPIGQSAAIPTGAERSSPGMLSVSGVFTDPQFQMVLRGLNQAKGVDMLASPTVFAKSGQRSELRMIRELRFPKEYNAAQAPTSSVGAGPVTPATPTSYDKRDVGVILEVEPSVGEGGVVEVNLVPSFVSFEGFVDYGMDFTASAPDGPLGQPRFYRVPNSVVQPIFRTSRISTAVSIWSGSTVVLGGATFERTTKIDDKVPVVGDMPLVGRSFQSKVGKHERINILFFVTVRIVDPGGGRIEVLSAHQGQH